MKKYPIIESDTIVLREILPEEIDQIVDISFYNGKLAADRDEALEMLMRIDKDYLEGNTIHWGIVDKESNLIMGTIGYYRGFSNGIGEMGFVLKKEYRGKGIMSEAVRLAAEYGLNVLKLSKVTAITTVSNHKAIKVIERANFKKTKWMDDERVEYVFS